MIEADESNIGVLSCGEQIAAAFIFNRMDWLPSGYEHPLTALRRLGANWLSMAQDYHQSHG
jgi:hypothetical protein